jgi:hypothetical protein
MIKARVRESFPWLLLLGPKVVALTRILSSKEPQRNLGLRTFLYVYGSLFCAHGASVVKKI